MHRWSGEKTVASAISHAQGSGTVRRVIKHVQLNSGCTYLRANKHVQESEFFCYSSKLPTPG